MRLGIVVHRHSTAETIAAAEAVERHGAYSLWMGEDLFERGGVPMAAACAVRTDRIRIGVGVTNLFTTHPTQYAMEYAALSEMSNNRAIVSLGAGVKVWNEQMGFEYRPGTGLRESIEIIRALLRGERVTYRGRVFDVEEQQLGFRLTDPPPMHVGAMGPRTVHTCGEMADGWNIPAFMPVGYTRKAMAWLRAGAAEVGRDPDEIDVVQYVLFSCDADSKRAKDALKPLLASYVAPDAELFASQPVLAEAMQGNYERLSQEDHRAIARAIGAGGDPVEVVPDELVDELAIAGTVDECVEMLGRYAAAGVDELALHPWGSVDEAARMAGEVLGPRIEHALTIPSEGPPRPTTPG